LLSSSERITALRKAPTPYPGWAAAPHISKHQADPDRENATGEKCIMHRVLKKEYIFDLKILK
jgi:hypothetical protein